MRIAMRSCEFRPWRIASASILAALLMLPGGAWSAEAEKTTPSAPAAAAPVDAAPAAAASTASTPTSPAPAAGAPETAAPDSAPSASAAPTAAAPAAAAPNTSAPVAAAPAAKPYVATCEHAATFETIVDVGHTAEVAGAQSARGVYEYEFNLRLASRIDRDLRAAGFERTVLMITSQKSPRGLFSRAARANTMGADLFLAVHHDAVPDSFLQTWQVAGEVQHYSDRFPGHSLFVSYENADPRGSRAFGHLLGMALKARGLTYTPHYTEKYMKHYRHELVDTQAGVYRYDQLIVLRATRMPAVLLEAGSIVNRDEELVLETPERQELISSAVVEAVDAFCTARSKTGPRTVIAKRADRSHRP